MLAICLIISVMCICKTAVHITTLIVKAKYPVYNEPEFIKDVDDDEQPVNFDDIIAELYNREEDN